MRAKGRVLLLLLLGVLSMPAGATTLLALDIPALTKSSAVIARGTVQSVESRWTKDGGRIMTDAVLQVTEVWKGAPDKRITVMQPGGVVGDIGQRVEGTARFSVGEDVVVFLEPRGNRFLVTGMVQGKFKVEISSDGKSHFARQEGEGGASMVDPTTHLPVEPELLVMPLDRLRAQVLAASGATAPAERNPQEPTSPGLRISP